MQEQTSGTTTAVPSPEPGELGAVPCRHQHNICPSLELMNLLSSGAQPGSYNLKCHPLSFTENSGF